ncbi:MAG: tetratricopeptide repeat protein, partial [Alphaproteobacteria bacterium]|nr:tetratricopeptide repeat protein [Alphaproteobacteria bacterium]
HNNLGGLLRSRFRLDEAELCCRDAVRLSPGSPPILVNLGCILREQGRFAEAEKLFRTALQSSPHHIGALNNLGGVLFDLGRPSEAIASLRAAIRQAPNHADAHVNLASSLLLAGQFAEGWAEYEWRWQQPHNKPLMARFGKPGWGGEDIGDGILLLHAEQGLGDTLQFCRYVPGVAAQRRVILEVPSPLVTLLAGLPGIERIVARGDALPPFDVHCPLLSLPRLLGTDLETIPRKTPYLRADPGRVAAWRGRVGALDGLSVGLVWAGNPALAADRRRSIALEHFAPLAGIPGISFVSLQKGPAAEQAKSPPSGLVLHDWTPELSDFTQTAALIEALDLVIGVDTAVVHLAGALGRPVWLLNRFDRCWRWLLDREDSPWYPLLRQFRQAEPGDWRGVLTRVQAALRELGERVVRSGRNHHRVGIEA